VKLEELDHVDSVGGESKTLREEKRTVPTKNEEKLLGAGG